MSGVGLGVAVIVEVGVVPPDNDKVGDEGVVGLVWQAEKIRAADKSRVSFLSMMIMIA